MRIFFIFFIFLVLASPLCLAVDDVNFSSEPNESNSVQSYDSWSKGSSGMSNFSKEPSLMSRLVVSLLLVGGLGAAAYIMTKKMGHKISAASGKNIKIIEAASIGNQRHILLVECQARKFLIGSSGQTISLISELDKEQQ